MPPLTPRTVQMRPSPFLRMPARAPGMVQVRVPSIQGVQEGIRRYRKLKGMPLQGNREYPFREVKGILTGRTFMAGGRRHRIQGVKIHQVAGPIYPIGNRELRADSLIGTNAAAIAAHPVLGTGGSEGDTPEARKAHAKVQKTMGDTAATEAKRAADKGSVGTDGRYAGGEGGGRDEMGMSAAIYRGERYGTARGHQVRGVREEQYVDPLEVTNGTKVLNLEGGSGGVGEGYDASMENPENWFPGYSGVLSIALFVDAQERGFGTARPLSDFLYMRVRQNKPRAASFFAENGITLDTPVGDVTEALSTALRREPKRLLLGSLARPRHTNLFEQHIEGGIEPWNVFTPSDGNSMWSAALAGGIIDMADDMGGVNEAVIGAAAGVAMGVRTEFQFASAARLKEAKADADLLNDEDRFGFSSTEYSEMLTTLLFDGEHIGHTLRLINPRGEIASHVTNMAFDEEEVAGFDFKQFRKEWVAIVDFPNAEDKDSDRMKRLLASVDLTAESAAAITRFSDPSRMFLKKALKEYGFLDVRDVHTFQDMVRTRDWLYSASALTANRWAPLDGIKVDEDGNLVVETLVVGGSNVVYVLETHIAPAD